MDKDSKVVAKCYGYLSFLANKAIANKLEW